VPLFALNQVNEDRVEWLVPGMLKEKIQALLKSLPQKARSRFVPLPESAARLAQELSEPVDFGSGSLVDALLTRARTQTGLEIKRTDFKLDMVPTHLFMVIRVIDDHGRQLGVGRNLAALKAEWSNQARGAFQALAALKSTSLKSVDTDASASPLETRRTAGKESQSLAAKDTNADSAQKGLNADERYTNWTFGELPELLEVRRKGQKLIGFPALADDGDAVRLEVFDEPDAAAVCHLTGLRRLVALQIKETLKFFDRNIPDLQKMAMIYMSLGSTEELRTQILNLAIDRAFLQEPLPQDAVAFSVRVQQGRGRLALIAQEIARLTHIILTEYAATQRKIKDIKVSPEATQDIHQQLQHLIGKRFLLDTPWLALQHFPRYLKAVQLRLDKWRTAHRDAEHMQVIRVLEQRFWRLVAERKGHIDTRMQDFRWMLEELRVSLFAQELRTPQPVSLKRLEKVWAQIGKA
jgi:ATP-dependent helicase HrpA